jgi:hypothetical protein
MRLHQSSRYGRDPIHLATIEIGLVDANDGDYSLHSALVSLSDKAYGDVSGHNCWWCAGGTGPVWRRALGVEVRQALRLVSLVIARAATGDLVTVKGRLC